jgi:hypothetical protein
MEKLDGRAIVPGIRLERGEFYGGKRTTVALSGIWRPSPHLVLQGNYDRNDVSLLQGDFVVHLVRARFTVPITARASVDAFIQRNGLNPQGDPELNTQIRFHLIFAATATFILCIPIKGGNALRALSLWIRRCR